MPDTVVYASNAGGPEIHVMAMDRDSGDLELVEQVAVPGAPSPSHSQEGSRDGEGAGFLYRRDYQRQG